MGIFGRPRRAQGRKMRRRRAESSRNDLTEPSGGLGVGRNIFVSHVPCKRSRWCCAASLILCVLNGTQGGASGTQNPLKRVKKPTCRYESCGKNSLRDQARLSPAVRSSSQNMSEQAWHERQLRQVASVTRKTKLQPLSRFL